MASAFLLNSVRYLASPFVLTFRRGGPPADRGPRFDRGGRAGGGGDRGDRKSRWGGGGGDDDEDRNDGGGGGPEGGPPGGGPNPGVGLLGAAPPGFNPIVPLAAGQPAAPEAPPAGAPRQDEAEDAAPTDTADVGEPQKLSEELERSMQQADAPTEAAAPPEAPQSEPQQPAPSAGGFSLYDDETPLNPETQQPAATTEAESHPTHFEEEPQQQQVPDQQPQEQHAVPQPLEEYGGHEGNGVPNEGPGGHEGHDDLGGQEKAPEVAPMSSEPPADTQDAPTAADGGEGEGDVQPE